jgi:hypothetical protein
VIGIVILLLDGTAMGRLALAVPRPDALPFAAFDLPRLGDSHVAAVAVFGALSQRCR